MFKLKTPNLKTTKFKWISLKSGEIAPNIFYVISIIISDLRHYRIFNIPWKYNPKGW